MSDQHAFDSDYPEEPTSVTLLLSELKTRVASASRSFSKAVDAANTAVQEAKRRSSRPPPLKKPLKKR